ncbi:MAG TPA: hypothetical protein VFM21_10515 [Terriglobia bacterium]|nr:hypothetical protein [Terriglobia bacterium]
MFRKRLLAYGLVSGIVCVVAISVAAAQKNTPLAPPARGSEQGTFVLKLAGREYGTEKFSIESAEGKLTAQSETQLRDTETGQLIKTVSRLILNTALEPQSYAWSEDGPAKYALSVDFTEGVAKSRLHRPNGSDDVREIHLPRNVAILDNNVLIHYEVLIRRFVETGGGKQTFPAYIPQSATPGTLTVQDAGMETISLGGAQRSLRHLVVLSDNAQIDLWTDGNNRLQRLYWGEPQIEAVRQP